MNSQYESTWTSAYATTRLVGRAEELDKLAGAIDEAGERPQALFILSAGGIGKTRVLNALLKGAETVTGVVSAGSLIDLYDTFNHSAINLIRAIVDVLPGSGAAFRDFEHEYRQLITQVTSGALGDLGRQRKEVLAHFATDLVHYAAGRRVVLFFDTAERLIAVPGNEIGVQAEIAEAWQWLAGAFHQWRNVTLIVAGRPDAKALTELFQHAEAIDLRVETLAPFDEAESIAYFDAAAEAAEQAGAQRIANNLRGLPLEYRRRAFVVTGGRPILLALIADLSIIRGPEAVAATLNAAPPLPTARGGVRLDSEVEGAIIQRLMESPSLGVLLRQVGRLPRGAEEDLLRRLVSARGIRESELDDQLVTLRLLSFVKVRNQRYFLHDELYAILERTIYNKPADTMERHETLRLIVAYLEGQHHALLRELDEVFEVVEVDRRPDRLDRDRLARVMLRRRELLPELVYYHLRADAPRGFRHYYRYTFEAVISGDSTLDVQLQAAILNFLRDRDPDGKAEVVDQLERELVVALAIIRPVARHLADGNYPEAIAEAQRLRAEQAGLLRSAGPAAGAVLGVWEAYARTYRSHDDDRQVAQRLLGEAITTVKDLLDRNDPQASRSESRRWQTIGALALAHQVRGYLNRVSGAPVDAAADYQMALPLWRELKVEVNLATVLNDLGFALAEQGDTDDGRALAQEALERRRRLGARSPVGFSLNTLARIDIYSEKYSEAMIRAEQALSLFRALRHERGIVMAVTALAEATRRHSATAYAMSADEQARLLHSAARDAREASELATNEPLRRVEALIEVGCAQRDLLRLRERAPQMRENWARLADESRAALEEAAGLARKISHTYRHVDAAVNLAYLAYYLGDLEQAGKGADKALKIFPEAYVIDHATGRTSTAPGEERNQIWSQLGKLYVLFGLIAFERLRQVSAPEARRRLLEASVEYFFFSLECNLRYSSAFPGLSQSRNQIFNTLKTLGPDEREALKGMVQEIERRTAHPRSELRRLLGSRAI